MEAEKNKERINALWTENSYLWKEIDTLKNGLFNDENDPRVIENT